MRAFFTLLLLGDFGRGRMAGLGAGIRRSRRPRRRSCFCIPDIPRATSPAELKSAGVIRSTTAFIVWHRLHHQRSLKAGEYLFDKTATALDIHERLVRGDVYVHTVVIPEGFNMFEIAQAIQDAGLGSSQDFLKAAESQTALIADLAPEAKTLEGYLFPNTYEFTRTQTMEEMAAAMVKQFRQVAREIGLTADVQKTVTLASIIEKETAAPDERPLVAGVYSNRLAENMPLQADPSVIYAELLRGGYSGASAP